MKISQITLGFALEQGGEAVLLRLPRGVCTPGMAARLADGRWVTVKSFANINGENFPAFQALERQYPIFSPAALYAPVWRDAHGA